MVDLHKINGFGRFTYNKFYGWPLGHFAVGYRGLGGHLDILQWVVDLFKPLDKVDQMWTICTMTVSGKECHV